MHATAFVNDSFRPASEAASASILYGKGVFTTIAIFGGEPYLWDKHWVRLTSDAGTLGIDTTGFTESSVREALVSLIGLNDVETGRARLTFIDRRASGIWESETNGEPTGLMIITGKRRVVPDPFRLTLSPYRINTTSPLAGVKSCNYLEHVISADEAHGRGFNEALRLNERGEIASAAMANIFWVAGGQLYTPALSTGCLAGTTRGLVLDNLECTEATAQLSDLATAEAIFLTSAGLGVVAVGQFEGQVFEQMDHPIMKLMPPSGQG